MLWEVKKTDLRDRNKLVLLIDNSVDYVLFYFSELLTICTPVEQNLYEGLLIILSPTYFPIS